MLFNGFSGDKESFDGVRDRQKDAFMVTKSDTIIYQRPDSYEKLESAILLQKAGKKIVFDNDDTYKDLNPMRVDGLAKRDRALDTFIGIADLVTTTTEFLAEEYRKLNKNVVVLKNYINPNDYPTPKRNEGDKVRIGIFGSTTLNGDSGEIKELLQELSERDDVTLVYMGVKLKLKGYEKSLYQDDIDFWKKLKIEHHENVSIKDYRNALNDLRLDFCLIPRKDNYFNRCKSNIKFLEASMLEIPCIAQGFEDGKSPYQGEEDRRYMLIAKDIDNWRMNTEHLIKNKKSREIFGKGAHQYVLENYNIQKHYKEWADAYKNL
jgi:glycosyltransferase involved in cell wall biosynthesis